MRSAISQARKWRFAGPSQFFSSKYCQTSLPFGPDCFLFWNFRCHRTKQALKLCSRQITSRKKYIIKRYRGWSGSPSVESSSMQPHRSEVTTSVQVSDGRVIWQVQSLAERIFYWQTCLSCKSSQIFGSRRLSPVFGKRIYLAHSSWSRAWPLFQFRLGWFWWIVIWYMQTLYPTLI